MRKRDLEQFILDDLEEAINVLPVKWEQNEYGRATRGAAVALRGKVKLFNRDYSGAATDFEEVVNDLVGEVTVINFMTAILICLSQSGL